MKIIDIPATLEKAEHAVVMLRVAYNLKYIEDYTKDDAVEELVESLLYQNTMTFVYTDSDSS